MIKLDIKPKAKKFIALLPPKQMRQIKDRILKLQKQPLPHDAKHLRGYNPYIRVDAGEYRIIYRLEAEKLLTIVLVGKRNDDEVYRKFKRIYKTL